MIELEYSNGSEMMWEAIVDFYNCKASLYGNRIHEYDDDELFRIYQYVSDRKAYRSHSINFSREETYEIVRESAILLDEQLKKHEEYIELHPEIQKKKNGFHVASFRFPFPCSLSFTNQFRRQIQNQIEEKTRISEYFDRELIMECYKRIILAPVGYSLITKNISDSFTTFCRDRSDSGQAYTFYHSMLVMPYMLFHYTDYPRLLFFWTKVRSKSQPNTPVKTYMEYPDDDLIFEISEYAPPGFPNEYAKLFQPIRTDLKVYEPYLYKNTGDKKYFRNFIVDPVAWKEWIVPCCAHIDNCLKRLAGNQSGQSSSENNTSSQDESDNKKENVIAEIVAGMKGINKALFEFTNNSGEGFPDVIFDIEYSIEPEKETVDNLHDLLDSYQKQHKNIINYFNVTAPGSCFCSAHIDFGEADEKNLKDVIRIIHNSDNRIKKIRIE